MTVVAAIAWNGQVVMAADTCTNYQGTDLYGAVKIRPLRVGATDAVTPAELGTALVAASGDGALLSITQRHLKIHDVPDPSDHDEVQAWADAIATAVSEVMADQNPPVTTPNGGECTTINGALLLGWAGHLFYLFTHQAVRVPSGIAALGSGCDTALGVLHALRARSVAPVEAVTEAVLTASRFIGGCRVDETGPLVRRCPEVATDAG